MRKSGKFTLRMVVLIGLVALLHMALAPTAPATTPYASALSHHAIASPQAGGCPNKACDHGLECFAAAGYKCIRFNGKGCTANPC
jgi:hypothetical protein